MNAQRRRSVRVTEQFFAQLDGQLGPDRSDDGSPSATDFLVFDLPPVVERFATGFDSLPEVIDGFPAARMLIAGGLMVRTLLVYGLLVDTDTIELVGLDLDLSW